MRNELAMLTVGLTIVLATAAAPLALGQDAADNATNTSAGPPAGDAHATIARSPCSTSVNCTGGTRPAGNATSVGTCMDGQQGNESCDPNVRYLGGPAAPRAGNGTASPSDGAALEPAAARAVPALAAAGIVGAAVLATVLLSLRRP